MGKSPDKPNLNKARTAVQTARTELETAVDQAVATGNFEEKTWENVFEENKGVETKITEASDAMWANFEVYHLGDAAAMAASMKSDELAKYKKEQKTKNYELIFKGANTLLWQKIKEGDFDAISKAQACFKPLQGAANLWRKFIDTVQQNKIPEGVSIEKAFRASVILVASGYLADLKRQQKHDGANNKKVLSDAEAQVSAVRELIDLAKSETPLNEWTSRPVLVDTAILGRLLDQAFMPFSGLKPNSIDPINPDHFPTLLAVRKLDDYITHRENGGNYIKRTIDKALTFLKKIFTFWNGKKAQLKTLSATEYRPAKHLPLRLSKTQKVEAATALKESLESPNKLLPKKHHRALSQGLLGDTVRSIAESRGAKSQGSFFWKKSPRQVFLKALESRNAEMAADTSKEPKTGATTFEEAEQKAATYAERETRGMSHLSSGYTEIR